jgi:hypothetical protein
MRIMVLALGLLLALETPALTEPALAPGKPAGVRVSISKSNEIIYLGAAALAAGGMGLLMVGKKNGGISLSNLAVTTTTP